MRSLSPNDLLKLDAGYWELLSRAYPAIFLAKLETALGLTDLEILAQQGLATPPPNLRISRLLFTNEETLSTSSSRTVPPSPEPIVPAPLGDAALRKPIPFEFMCKLYYQQKPKLLPFFVQLMSLLQEKAENQRKSWNESTPRGPTFRARALFALPPCRSDMMEDQIMCRFEVSYYKDFIYETPVTVKDFVCYWKFSRWSSITARLWQVNIIFLLFSFLSHL